MCNVNLYVQNKMRRTNISMDCVQNAHDDYLFTIIWGENGPRYSGTAFNE